MAEMKFEDAMKRIEEIVNQLEKGDLPLEQALEHFEEAIKLARICQAKLEDAQQRISKLVREGEDFRLEPFETEGS
ncbi:MAG TPA: exodeoxyribonuclease VII small subunit [Firmicutes bacterium]|nr:exodeoxyribonuclease VII small subunit [Bacillota bacterium]